MVCALLPSHEYPLGHAVHAVRLNESLPLVKDPAGHMVHAAALPALNLESSPHRSHLELPAAANAPAMHCITTLLPEHALPAGQVVQAVRCVGSLPVVYDPSRHVPHETAPTGLYLLSSLQAMHSALPRAAKRPPLHSVQLVAVGVATDLKWPAAQVLHEPAPEPPHAVWYWPTGHV